MAHLRMGKPPEDGGEGKEAKRRYTKADRLEIELKPVDVDGTKGHEVRTHFTSNDGSWREPDKAVFTDHQALLDHVSSHLRIGKGKEVADGEEE